jgi:predicted phosphodiesterase
MKLFVNIFKLLILIFSISFTASAQIQDPDSLYFVQITDTHVGQDFQRTLSIIEAINKLPYKLDFVVHTGDIFDHTIDQSVLSERFKLFKKLSIPIYFVQGNADIGSKNHQLIKDKIGKLNYIMEHKGIILCFISSLDPVKNNPKNVPQWLHRILPKHQGKSILLFHHEPFMKYFYKDNLKEWQGILKKYDFLGVFSGHMHRDALMWHKNVPEFVAPCIVEFKGRQASFRLYEIKDGHISYSTFYVNDK